jgi:hypothetical protein
MSYQTFPATKVQQLTDFSSDVVPDVPFRKLYCIGGATLSFKDGEGTTITVLAADYAAVNNQAIYITQINSATDCTTIYAST